MEKEYENLLKLTLDDDDRIAYNAMRIMVRNVEWCRHGIYADKNYLIDNVINERHKGKCRLMLTLLLRLGFEKCDLRTDFLNYCLDGMMTEANPCSVRVLCMKLAYEQCLFYPELLAELKSVLHHLAIGNMSPGIMTARRNILNKM